MKFKIMFMKGVVRTL